MVKIDNRHVRSTGWKRKDRSHLRSATEVHWRGLKRNWVEKRRLHVVLSVLPIIPNIRLLSLYRADINEAQQAVIFGLSTLRTLEVEGCRFHSSTMAPPFSHVTALKLTVMDVHTTRRLITIFASTLETLSIGYFCGRIDYILQTELIELPKLTTFTMSYDGFGTSQLTFDAFRRYTSITTLHIFFYDKHFDISVHRSDLPALRSLTCYHHLAISLIPERPVTTYVEVLFAGRKRFWTLLHALSMTQAGITNLKLFVPDTFCSLLPSLATYLQHLEQLTLRFCNHVPSLETPSPSHLSEQLLHNPPVVLPKLRRVTILVDYDKFHLPPESLLKECFIPLCPALEVFECLYCSFMSPIFWLEFDQLPGPKGAWEVRRLPDGSWERQGPPPIPIPIPIPAGTLRAAL